MKWQTRRGYASRQTANLSRSFAADAQIQAPATSPPHCAQNGICSAKVQNSKATSNQSPFFSGNLCRNLWKNINRLYLHTTLSPWRTDSTSNSPAGLTVPAHLGHIIAQRRSHAMIFVLRRKNATVKHRLNSTILDVLGKRTPTRQPTVTSAKVCSPSICQTRPQIQRRL